jgi:hypothetical protein
MLFENENIQKNANVIVFNLSLAISCFEDRCAPWYLKSYVTQGLRIDEPLLSNTN